MDRKTYRDAFDRIPFSPDIEKRIVDAAENMVLPEKKKIRWKIAFVPIICCLAVLLLLRIPYGHLERGLLSDTALENLEGVRQIRTDEIEEEEDGAVIENTSVKSGEMVVFDYGIDLQAEGAARLSGSVSREDCAYEIGYICNGTYNSLGDYSDQTVVTEELLAQETGTYYFCITNLSEETLEFSGKIARINNLLYYPDAVFLEEGTRISIDTDLLKTEEKIKGCYIQNCAGGEVKEIPTPAGSFEIQESGNYRIYAVTEDNTMIDLSQRIGIEKNVKTGDGFQAL